MKERFEAVVEHLLDGNIFLGQAIEILEHSMIRRAMERAGGVQSTAAKQLGIHRNTLQTKIVHLGLATARPRARKKPPVRQGRPRGRKTGAA